MSQFQVRKDDFAQHRLVSADPEPLADGQVRVAIERFAYTANNVTYAAAGDTLGYWQFFPPAHNTGDAWGMTPVWGFAKVTESKHPDVPVSERLFGYWPPAEAWVLQPDRVGPQRLFDAAPHRAKLPPTYNAYSRVAAEPGYDPAHDPYRMLLWPLYVTAFCLCDVLESANNFDAEQVIILSASSKTAIGLAQGLAGQNNGPEVLGVTSTRNQAFVSTLDCYSQVCTYDDLTALDKSRASVFVDMSGNSQLLAGLIDTLGDKLQRGLLVGMTHWDEAGGAGVAAHPKCDFFFAPSHIQQRTKEWGADGFAQRSQAFLASATAQAQSWLDLTAVEGLDALAVVYPDVCAGTLPPQKGLIVSP